MNDRIVRAMTRDGYVKASAITSAGIVERARQIHRMLPVATAALGRVLTAASMMGNLQKVDDGSLTLQIKGDGPLGTILAVSDAVGNVRGYVTNPQTALLEKRPGKLDVGAAVGRGMLTVIRDLRLKEPYVGSVELVSGEIAEDLTDYFVQSEQTPTACALGVLVDVDQSVRAAGAVTAQLAAGQGPEELLRTVLSGFDLEILETTPVAYRCYCSRQRVESTLISLGRKELQEIADGGEDVHVGCQFCDADYVFTPEQVRQLLSQL